MSRKLTRVNPLHPVAYLNQSVAGVFKAFRRLSNLELRVKLLEMHLALHGEESTRAWAATFYAQPPGRAAQLRKVEELTTFAVKRDWLKAYGWPFDDVYDPVKLQQRAQEQRDKAEEEKLKTVKRAWDGGVNPVVVPANTDAEFA